jgi:hypothetical protein
LPRSNTCIILYKKSIDQIIQFQRHQLYHAVRRQDDRVSVAGRLAEREAAIQITVTGEGIVT